MFEEFKPGDAGRLAALEVALAYLQEFLLIVRRVDDEAPESPSAQVALDQIAQFLGGDCLNNCQENCHKRIL